MDRGELQARLRHSTRCGANSSSTSIVPRAKATSSRMATYPVNRRSPLRHSISVGIASETMTPLPANLSTLYRMSDVKTFTGRPRRRQTRRSVQDYRSHRAHVDRIGRNRHRDRCSTVCIFLVWVVVPLFLPASVERRNRCHCPRRWPIAMHFEVDEYRAVGWCMSIDCRAARLPLGHGERRSEAALFPEIVLTAWSFGVGGREVICGFADGSGCHHPPGFHHDISLTKPSARQRLR